MKTVCIPIRVATVNYSVPIWYTTLMPVNWNTVRTHNLIRAICSFKTPDGLRLFFDDLMTEVEIEHFSKRLYAAELMNQGAPYKAIRQLTGFSPNTIAKISKQMINKKGGFQEALLKLYPHGRRYHE